MNADLQQATAAAERVFEILDTHSEVRDRPRRHDDVAVLAGDRVPGRRFYDGADVPT